MVAVCELIEEKARTIGKRLGVKWSTDYRELLDAVDSLWICVDLDEADAMIEACRKAGVKFMLGYVLRFTNPYRLMRDTLASGELGELVLIPGRQLGGSSGHQGRHDCGS